MTRDVAKNLSPRDSFASQSGLGVQCVFLQDFTKIGQRQSEHVSCFQERVGALILLDRNLTVRRLSIGNRFHGHIIAQSIKTNRPSLMRMRCPYFGCFALANEPTTTPLA